MYAVAATRYYLLYRRRPAVMLISVITAFVLLAEAMVAVVMSRNWHAAWWEWHLLMAAGFGFVAYSAYVQYQREGAARGLFNGISIEQTVRRVQEEYGAALEALTSAMHRQEEAGWTEAEMALIISGLARRFGLTEGQAEVLSRAAEALAHERDQIRRLDALVAVGRETRVIVSEPELLQRMVARIAEGLGRDSLRIGLLVDGQVTFPAGLSTGDGWGTGGASASAIDLALASLRSVPAGDGLLVLPLTVKDRPAGVVEVRRPAGRFAERDHSLLASLVSQLSIALENARLYNQIDVLFHQYISPDVATALLADPTQAALGGAVVEVSALFADLRGFTTFAERSSPQEVVAMLNRYFGLATPSVLAEGGTIVQFIGDALLALFNAPARQPDHALRAARAALAMQRSIDEVVADNAEWPRFRIGINTGPAVVGNIGSLQMRSFNATGDAVNIASRLESIAQPGQVVIGGQTAVAIRDVADLQPLGDLQVKGRQDLVTAYVLTGLRERADRPDGDGGPVDPTGTTA
jgi:class 3 adenylate cyclase